jgi:hypothetical protein
MSDDVPAVPDPDPVAEALRMRASDADRDRVAGILRDAYAEGRLTAVEHEERLAEVYRATTYGDLVPVLRDLPVPPGTLAVPITGGLTLRPPDPSPSGTPAIHAALAGTAEGSPIAIFGAFERHGSWTVPAEMNATCIFGGGELDLTEARLTSHETVITAVALFGGLEITVPAGMAVRSEVVGIFGGTEVPPGEVPAGAPVLVLKGAAIFGGVQVRRADRTKKKGWVSRS